MKVHASVKVVHPEPVCGATGHWGRGGFAHHYQTLYMGNGGDISRITCAECRKILKGQQA